MRQYSYRYLIDDPTPRNGYLYGDLSPKFPYTWYDRRRPLMATITNIGVFVAVCGYIHLLFGWKAALLYAVFPLNVSGVAWITGNYYMSTVLLCLASYAALGYGLIGAGVSAVFYGAALNSTLLSLPFFVVLSLFPMGWLSLIPLIGFLFGKRLKTGLTKRKVSHDGMGVQSGFAWRNFYHVPRVLAYYLYLSFYPARLGFFHAFGKNDKQQTVGFWLASVLVMIASAVFMAAVDWRMAVWWFASMGVFSQFIIFGQFVTERYTPLANVAFCVIAAAVLPTEAFWAIGALWFYRSLDYIPAWKSDERLFSYSATQFKEAGENWVNLGSYYLERKDSFSAIKPLLVAEKLVKGDKYGIYCDLANCYASGGFFEKALEYTDKALGCATLDKITGMLEQKQTLESKIYKMQKGNRELKKMGVI